MCKGESADAFRLAATSSLLTKILVWQGVDRRPSPLGLEDSPKSHCNNEAKHYPLLSPGPDAAASKHDEDTTETDLPQSDTPRKMPSVPVAEMKIAGVPIGLGGFVVGDVVRATLDAPIRYEGVVVDIDVQQETLKVDFGDTWENIPVEQCIKVLSWDSLEVGDQVQVRPEGLYQYFTGKVAKVNADGTYQIQYEDEEDAEDNVKLSNIRKLASGRTMASKRWKAAIHVVRTTTALAGLIRKKTHSESFDSAN